MLELFGVLFITLFIAFLLTLVVLNLDMMFNKGKVEKVRRSSFGFTKERAERISLNTQKAYCKKYANVSNEELVESKALKDCYKAWTDFDLGWDFGSNKDRSVRTRYKQKHGGTIEFIDCKWDEDRKEVNEIQNKYLETLPKHKTRIKLRNKRKGKK